MRVTMVESRRSAPDGVNVVFLNEGEEYDLPQELAASYLERGIASAEAPAKAVEESKPADEDPDLDDKNDGGAEETKPAPKPRSRSRRSP